MKPKGLFGCYALYVHTHMTHSEQWQIQLHLFTFDTSFPPLEYKMKLSFKAQEFSLQPPLTRMFT